MRRSRLRRKTPLKAGGALLRRTPLASRQKSTGPAAGVVDAVLDRASHSCEICSVGVGPVRGTDHHLHHRRPRAAGGSRRPDTNLPSNLLLLCPPCHGWLESHRAVAQMSGWLVPQIGDPAATAVLIQGCRWVYLSPDGRYLEHPPNEMETP